jgi:integrase
MLTTLLINYLRIIGYCSVGFLRFAEVFKTAPKTAPFDKYFMYMNLYLKGRTINARIFRNGTEIKISTQVKLRDPKQWLAKSKKIKIVHPSDFNLRDQLNDWVERVEKIIYDHPTWSNARIKNAIKGNSVFKAQEVLPIEAFNRMINHYKNIGQNLSASRYSRVLVEMEKIQKEYEWADFDMSYYDTFISHYSRAGLKKNTIGRAVTYLKTMLRWAELRGYHRNPIYKQYKSFSEDVTIIFMEEDEVKILYNFSYKNEKHRRVVDLFTLMCHTGLRHSDAIAIKPAYAHKKYLSIPIQKTGEKNLVIPLSATAREILQKYEYQMPPISSQKMNDYLKEAAKIAELNREVSTDKGVTKLHEVISSKLGRKTFVSISINRGMPADVVMSITGHKTYEVMRRYLKINAQTKIDLIEKYWSF